MSFQNGAFIGIASAISAVQLYNFSKHFSKVPDASIEKTMSEVRGGMMKEKIVMSKLEVEGVPSGKLGKG